MACIIIDIGGERRGTDLGVRTSIGRADRSGLVVDHPTVSRVHAWIVRQPGSGRFVIRDNASRNGTYVDGERLSGRRTLRDGARIRVGPARLTFRAASLSEVAPKLPPVAKPRTDPNGITFDCGGCGARLWAAARRAGKSGSCPKCKAGVTYPIAQDLELAPADLTATVAGLVLDPASDEAAPVTAPEAATAAPAPAPQTAAYELCSICQSSISDCDGRTACPCCGLHFHADCWTENCGCSAYGCPQVNALAAESLEASPSERETAQPDDEPEAKPFVPVWVDEPAGRFPWKIAVLAALVLVTFAGVMISSWWWIGDAGGAR